MDYSDLSNLFSLVGLPLTLLQFWQAERQQLRASTDRDAQEALEHYLEWLRREGHKDIVLRLESSALATAELHGFLQQLLSATDENSERIMSQLDTLSTGLSTKLDATISAVDRVERKLSLFVGVEKVDQTSRQFEMQYLECVKKEFDRLKFIGLRSMREVPTRTSIAFVSLNVRADAEDSEPLPAEQVLLLNPTMTIRGPAGAGKTTLFSWIALQCAESLEDENPWRHGIPFVIPLRNLVAEEKGIPRVDRFLDYTLRPNQYDIKAPAGWIGQVLSEHRAVLLIDGVDELPPSQRPDFWRWLAEFQENYPSSRIYVSSRPFKETGANGELLWEAPASFSACELDDLDGAAIKTLIENWHDAVAGNTTNEEELAELNAYRKQLPTRLSDPANRRVRDLCRNPLLCAMVCALNWIRQGDLPQRRVDLYEECCDVLIHTRDERRQIRTGEAGIDTLTREDKYLLLQRLAWSMLCNRVDVYDGQHWEVSRSDAESWMSPHLPRLNHTVPAGSAGRIIDYLVERTSLIRIPAAGRIDFPHRTFQEYLAACAAGAENQYGMLSDRVCDDQWRETIVLAAGTSFGGIPFGNRLIETLLDKGEKSNRSSVRTASFALALACCDTARQVNTDLKQRVLKHLGEIAPPIDFEMADMLAAGGDAVLPWLEYRKLPSRPARRMSAAARSLARIGTERAAEMLTDPGGYGGDDRATVVLEACGCSLVHPIQFLHVRKCKSETAKSLLYSSLYDTNGVLPDPPKWCLEAIELVDFSYKPVPDAAPLANLTGVSVLNLFGSLIRDLAPLGKLENLRFLDLRNTRADCSTIPSFPALHMIWLDHISNLEIQALSRQPKLFRLDAEWAKIVDGHAIAQIKTLTHVDLSSADGIDFEATSTLPSLNYLGISSKHLPLFAACAGFASLRNLCVRGEINDEIRHEIQAKFPRVSIVSRF